MLSVFHLPFHFVTGQSLCHALALTLTKACQYLNYHHDRPMMVLLQYCYADKCLWLDEQSSHPCNMPHYALVEIFKLMATLMVL